MNNKKQITAIEWFYRWFNDNQEATHQEFIEAFEQSKQMEKEQIMDAFNEGYRDGENDATENTPNVIDIAKFGNAENYYDDTYGEE